MGYLAYMRANRPAWNPLHWRNRGWDDGSNHFGDNHEEFDMPIPLLFTAASGLNNPVLPDDGSTLLRPYGKYERISRPTHYAWRDRWIVASAYSYALNRNTASAVNRLYCAPVRPFPKQTGDRSEHGKRMDLDILCAPFPITVDTGLTLFSTCSLGHTDDPPFMPPYNGSPSRAMVDLMNSFRMKPGYIVWNGYLHVWVNSLYWKQLPDADADFRYAMMGVPATLELELFKAYKAYYVQLQREILAPYRGPVAWPDQCDPRFPLPGDPRSANYIVA
ncbi:hypothetical protein [Bifidobacterium leontopitheci]|uniref:Uncharacterized protein n=1 Tax=Bifidobacterium leontopitheci TaxID=2650774 RepID=A0A6I1GBH2_9BIFI|nr:hypothetical protein [Bifidobacterium leontopitheci]KAB7788994.1 hypothetical protein F7D09_2051 [Bifidobacterium leontopitheci]